MTAARKLAPPPPASQTRFRATLAELRARAVRVLDRAAVEVRATRDEADARRELVRGRNDALDTMERRAADALDARARELDAAADELRWLASLS